MRKMINKFRILGFSIPSFPIPAFSTLLFSTLVLTACSTSSEVSSQYVGAVTKGKNGVIIASYGGETRCDNYRVTFENTASGETVMTSRIDADWMKSVKSSYDKIGFASARPGEYKIVKVTCDSFGSFVTFKGVADWFEPFEVQAGEAVYPGTLVRGVVKTTNERGRKLRYTIYESVDKSELVRAALPNRTPDLTDQFVMRLAPPRLDLDIVKKLLSEASLSETEASDPARRKAAIKAKADLAYYRVMGKTRPIN